MPYPSLILPSSYICFPGFTTFPQNVGPQHLLWTNNGEEESDAQKEHGPWRQIKAAGGSALAFRNWSFKLNCVFEQSESSQSVFSTENGYTNTGDFDV